MASFFNHGTLLGVFLLLHHSKSELKQSRDYECIYLSCLYYFVLLQEYPVYIQLSLYVYLVQAPFYHD